MKINYTPPMIEYVEECPEGMICTSVTGTGINDFTYETVDITW